MLNYYEVLEVTEDTTVVEIKKAYARMIRRYPPEKEAERYQQICEAYDTLSSKEKKIEYDKQLKYGEFIVECLEKIKKAEEGKEFNNAIIEYRKILEVYPEALQCINGLGIALLNNGNIEECKLEFLNAISLARENMVFYENLAYANEVSGNYKSAIIWYKKAIRIRMSVSSIRGYIGSCIHLGKQQQAMELTNYLQNISEDNFYYYFSNIVIYGYLEKQNEYKNYLEKMMELLEAKEQWVKVFSIAIEEFFIDLLKQNKRNILIDIIENIRRKIILSPEVEEFYQNSKRGNL